MTADREKELRGESERALRGERPKQKTDIWYHLKVVVPFLIFFGLLIFVPWWMTRPPPVVVGENDFLCWYRAEVDVISTENNLPIWLATSLPFPHLFWKVSKNYHFKMPHFDHEIRTSGFPKEPSIRLSIFITETGRGDISLGSWDDAYPGCKMILEAKFVIHRDNLENVTLRELPYNIAYFSKSPFSDVVDKHIAMFATAKVEWGIVGDNRRILIESFNAFDSSYRKDGELHYSRRCENVVRHQAAL